LSSWALQRWFFPLSRLWAAASIAQGSPERFFAAVPMLPPSGQRQRVLKLLARAELARVTAGAMDAAWQRAFFGGHGINSEEPSAAERVALESARLQTSHSHNTMRRHFHFLLRQGVPRVRYSVPSPEDMDAVYGEALRDAAPFFAPPSPMPAITVSRPVPTADGQDFWLRFNSPSPRLGDQVYARVYEPAGVSNPPTIIFGHGVCVEFDQWNGLIDEAAELRRLGIRVIRPEAPWHGRRVPPGSYGGERMVATFPLGGLDLFTGAVREWSVLADWARRTSSGALAFGGSSLGALTAQLAAGRARDWPQHLQPDALLLITHCAPVSQAMMHGDLVRMLGAADNLEAHGWTHDRLERYLSLLDPRHDPAVPPHRIVSVLGRRDRITPFAGGTDLIGKWGVPERNCFIWDRGHFSIPVTMMRDRSPLLRFQQIMA
jgi:hypothetical protein